MSKSKKINPVHQAINHLQKALDILEGQYSNIPDCCIAGYLDGRTYMNVRNSLPEKQIGKLNKWHYVPCESCFKKNKKNELKLNGMSVRGQIITTLINTLKEQKNDT